MFNRGFVNIIIGYGVLQLPLGSSGEENTLCYIRKGDANEGVCVPPNTVLCCNQHLSVDRIYVYGKITCNSAAKCNSGNGCCLSRDILNVSVGYVALLEEAFRRTHCFNDVDALTISQLPHNNGLVSLVVSYSCSDYTTATATSTTSVTSTVSAISTASTTSTQSATRTASASATVSTQHQLKTSEDGTSNVVIALAVSLSIVSVAFVVFVTVMCLRRNRATLHTSMAKANGIVTITRDTVQASTSGTQYVNVVPPTYEQLSRQHTDGEYSELFKDGRDCTHGGLSQEGKQWGSRIDQSAYYNGNKQAGHDGAYVNYT